MKPLSDDSAFEDYLSGGSGLSRAYAALGDEQPAARIDDAVLRAAREAVHQPAVDVAATRRSARRRWYVPLSAAAIVLLSFGLVLRMTIDPAGEASQDAAVDAGRAVPEAYPRRLPAEARGEKARAFEAAGSAKVTAGHLDAAGRCGEAAPTAADTASDGPADRLARIRCLIEAGDDAAARREIARLEKAFPRQSIPADLRERAGAETE